MVALSAICIALGSMGALVGFMLAWYLRKDKKWVTRGIIIGIICIVLFIVGMVVYSSELPSGSSLTSGDSARCRICDTRYSDRDNVKSINHTNMCKRCYNNYKYAADAAGY